MTIKLAVGLGVAVAFALAGPGAAQTAVPDGAPPPQVRTQTRGAPPPSARETAAQ
jgi:hypothetical protein